MNVDWNNRLSTPTLGFDSRLLTFTDRTVIAFESDADPQHITQFLRILPKLADVEIDDSFDARTAIFPELRVVVAPVPTESLTAKLDHLEHFGVVAADRERVSYVPPSLIEITPDVAPSAESPLDRTRVTTSSKSGSGVRIAMLDTGFDFSHPDFQNLQITQAQLAPFLPPQDKLGHGTHTTGIACGPKTAGDGNERYGIAYGSSIFIARVINKYSMTTDEALFAGITTAWLNGAKIVALCLGASVDAGMAASTAFEVVAKLLLDNDVLLVAAAGNDPAGVLYPVNHPANCRSVMAVAAVGPDYAVWDRSCGQVNADGEVNVAAPGYEIRSSALGGGYERRSGTSMASAAAAGVAALWAQDGARGRDLWQLLESSAAPVSGGTAQLVGKGLIQAPQ